MITCTLIVNQQRKRFYLYLTFKVTPRIDVCFIGDVLTKLVFAIKKLYISKPQMLCVHIVLLMTLKFSPEI